MKNKLIYNVLLGVTLLLASAACNNDDQGNNNNANRSTAWLIPVEQVFDGGPGKDGIPALTNPEFIAAADASYLNDQDLVLGIVWGNEARAYPHRILDWHEIVNDDIGNLSVAVVYCPLTGTGIGWDRMLTSGKTTFGVSGLLYNSNVIPYDRLTDSNWSQMLFQSVNGRLAGENARNISLLETNWGTWRQLYPTTEVLSTRTGFNRNYSQYPYGDYRTNHQRIIFPIANTNTIKQTKDRVLGIFYDGQAKVYGFEFFQTQTSLVTDIWQDKKIVVVGDRTLNFVVAFENNLLDAEELEFSAVSGQLPVVMTDNEGNRWDIFGLAVEGPRQGQQLTKPDQMIGYWFVFPAFYPNVEVFAEKLDNRD